jgi:L-ascorbate metabolism protein UlaG (beta-lactamase superfamily)
MNLGFDTIGNATVIVYDNKPLLATDPWITDSAYFGSWRRQHKIPTEQMEAIRNSEFIWFSHGHPDHLNHESLPLFRNQTILLPNHVGGRIKEDMVCEDYKVQILEDKKWVKLSDKVRVMCICDYFQDAILLIDVNGTLLINTNDANDRGWGRFARKVAKPFKTKFLLALFGYGDADMINFYQEDGTFILPKAAKKIPVGTNIADAAKSWGANYVVPFSSMHHYQRSDSVWANDYVTNLEDYKIGFSSKTCQLTDAYIRYDCETETFTNINPPEEESVIYEPEKFGDNWSDLLTEGGKKQISEYFNKIEHLSSYLDFINVRVGGKDNIFPLSKKNFNRGLTFEAPHRSLMTAIGYRIFDDLLIGNFMKTYLHGNIGKKPLYPDFTPYVSRYSDQADANSEEDVKTYFEEYQSRAGLDFVLHKFESKAINMFRARIEGGSKLFNFGKRMYWQIKKV